MLNFLAIARESDNLSDMEVRGQAVEWCGSCRENDRSAAVRRWVFEIYMLV